MGKSEWFSDGARHAERFLGILHLAVRVEGPEVERAAHASGAEVEDVGINHRGLYTAVAEQLLDRTDVVAALE
jgi:hypothetical protein